MEDDALAALNRPRALRGLAALLAADPEPLTARAFQEAVGYERADLAAEMRADLAAIGVVTTEEAGPSILVRLAPAGRTVTKAALDVEAVVPGLMDRPRALRALLKVREVAPEPLSARALRQHVGYRVEAAAQLRDDLAAWGLVDVAEGLENRVRFVRITLTPDGRKVADLAARLEAAARKAQAASARKKKDPP